MEKHKVVKGNLGEDEKENQNEPNVSEKGKDENATKDIRGIQYNNAREEAPLLSLKECWNSLCSFNNAIYKQYREEKGRLPDTSDTTHPLPVLRTSQVIVRSKQRSLDFCFQSNELLPDEIPTGFLCRNDFHPISSRVWVSQFTRSCGWMSSGAHRTMEPSERPQSLYCLRVDEDSPAERRLRDGDAGSWQLFNVLIAPEAETPIAGPIQQQEQTPQIREGRQVLQGGVIYHNGGAVGDFGGDGFLAGEVRCALSIIANQLRDMKKLELAQDIDFSQEIPASYARIVSISDTHLRVLDIRYDPQPQPNPCRDELAPHVSCGILFTMNLCTTINKTKGMKSKDPSDRMKVGLKLSPSHSDWRDEEWSAVQWGEERGPKIKKKSMYLQ